MRPTKANANALFQGLKSKPSYLSALNLSEEDEALLRNARRQIRACLREAFAALPRWVQYDEIVSDGHLSKSQYSGLRFGVRFLTQGSFAYETLNSPAYVPPQQIDLDDGVYIPMERNLHLHPTLLSRAFFILVERALAKLCLANGWGLDRSKATCVRVVLNGRAHIDLPLFAAPSSDFERLEKGYALSVGKSMSARANLNDFFRSPHGRGLRLPSDQIWMAHREAGWERSDPRRLQDWFEAHVDRLGPVLRRVCRYLKGWRDYHWESGGPASILLMASAVDALNALGSEPADNRDDLAMLEIARRLPRFWSGQIANPVPDQRPLDDAWSDEARQVNVIAAEALADGLTSALEGTFNRTVVVLRLQAAFGGRMPNAPDSISMNEAEQSKITILRQAAPSALPRRYANTSG